MPNTRTEETTEAARTEITIEEGTSLRERGVFDNTIASMRRWRTTTQNTSYGTMEITNPVVDFSSEWGTCSLCKLGHKKEILRRVEPDQSMFCLKCIEKCKLNKCAECEHLTTPDFLVKIRRENCSNHYNMSYGLMNEAPSHETQVCKNCIKTDYLECEECNKTCYRGRTLKNRDGKSICPLCQLERYFRCGGCRLMALQEEHHECEYCHGYTCSACEPRHTCDEMERSQYRKPAKVKLTGRKHKDFYTRQHVGIEIEAEGGNPLGLKTALPKVVGIAYDGSLRNGIEIQIPPSSCSELKKILTHSIDALTQRGYKVSSRCGLHIHLDATEIKDNGGKLSRLMKTYWLIEPIIFSMISKSRKESRFCIPLQKRYGLKGLYAKNRENMETKWYKNDNKSEKEYYKGEKYNGTRYQGVNMHSIFYRGSFELRHHQGTLSYEKMRHWINLNSLTMDLACNNSQLKALRRMALDFEQTNQAKITDFLKIIEAPEELRRYIFSRIKKFHPHYLQYKNLFAIYSESVYRKTNPETDEGLKKSLIEMFKQWEV